MHKGELLCANHCLWQEPAQTWTFLCAAEQLRKHSGLKCSFTVRHTQWVTVKPYWAKIILCSRRSPIQGHPVLFNSQSSALVHPNAIMELISCLYFPRHFTHYTNMVVESGIYCTRTQTKKTINPLWVVPIYRNTVKDDTMFRSLHKGHAHNKNNTRAQKTWVGQWYEQAETEP